MTHKTTMPDPVAYAIFAENGNIRLWSTEPRDLPDLDSLGPMHQLITTDQAEAYKDACVRESQQWQPIETAPQDGTFILAINAAKNPDLQHVVRYSERWGKHYPWVTGSGAMDFVAGVTHWMPLPPPPVE